MINANIRITSKLNKKLLKCLYCLTDWDRSDGGRTSNILSPKTVRKRSENGQRDRTNSLPWVKLSSTGVCRWLQGT